MISFIMCGIWPTYTGFLEEFYSVIASLLINPSKNMTMPVNAQFTCVGLPI